MPRSGLSHVLSGRNKPSLDYVLKILNEFPELDPYWLIKGQKSKASIRRIAEDKNENMDPEATTPNINQSLASVNRRMEVQADKLVSKISVEQPLSSNEIISSDKGNITKKGVDRIVYFYRDGSFQEYYPSK